MQNQKYIWKYWGLRINAKKCKIMVNSDKKDDTTIINS